MKFLQCWRSFQIFIILCGHLSKVDTITEVPSADNVTATAGEPFISATPPPGGAQDVNSTDAAVTLNSTLDLTENETLPATEATEGPSVTTIQPVVTSQGCLCDLTPDFCDIGCCCDTFDCGVANLSTVFAGCPQKPISGVCIEKWLMFRANVDSSLISVTDTLFCVRNEDSTPQSLPAVLRYPTLGDSYHFSPPASTSISHSRGFYRADDVIQTYFSSSSVRGLLRQPSPGVGTALCMNRNPAKFLRSVSLSCTRMITPRSCTQDSTLNARSYFTDLSLVAVPLAETEQVSLEFLIPVTPSSEWLAPSEQNNSCVNVVKKVEFVITYTDRGELTSASVNIVLADVDINQMLSQTHSVLFQMAASSPTVEEPSPAVGLHVGSPVIGRFDEEVKPLTTLEVSQNGACSNDPNQRAPVLFTHNTVSGCTFSSPAGNCSELRSQIYEILQGEAAPDVIAMNSGSQPDWTRVIIQKCPDCQQETCESGCLLPKSLSIRVLWARLGLLDLPQKYILGAKYHFQCQRFKCPVSSPIALTTEVTFADTTVYPKPPRGSPQPYWKFPFGFFTRGTAELDGHIISNGSGTGGVTWNLMLITAMMLTGVNFFTR